LQSTSYSGFPLSLGSAGAYRYSFNGQERDDEIAGAGNIMTAEFWEYDTRLGRRWNIDPVSYPWQSVYACFNNNPIFFVDPDGDEPTPDGKRINTNVSPTPWKVGSENSTIGFELKELVIQGAKPTLIGKLFGHVKSVFHEIGKIMDGITDKFGINIIGTPGGDINNARKPVPGMRIETIEADQLDALGMSQKEGAPFSWDRSRYSTLTDKRNQTEKPSASNSGPLDGMGAPSSEQNDANVQQRADSIHNIKGSLDYHYQNDRHSGFDSVEHYENGKLISTDRYKRQ